MQKVLGIGGIFFKAENPVSLSAWYEQNLGISMPPASYNDPDWQQAAGPTVFAPMESKSGHFDIDAKLYINFRVKNLVAMCAQLTKARIAVEVDTTDYPNGKFASLSDPEGNQIQLWQVKTPR
jgi:glyoxylase I family protein